MSSSTAPSLAVAGTPLRMLKVSADESDKREESRERAERARRSFATKKLSSSATLHSATPAKFRVASGRADAGDKAFRTDENHLAGWVMVAKELGNKRTVWRRQFVEVTAGVLRVFKTGPPINHAVGEIADLEVRVSFVEGGAAVELHSRETRLAHVWSDKLSKMQSIAEKVLDCRFGDQSNHSFMTTVWGEDHKAAPLLLSWDGATLSLFEKKLKRTMPLKGLAIETTEFPDLGNGHERQHKLHVSSEGGEAIVLTVPDALLLLQWCGAIASADSEPQKKGAKPSDDSIFNKVIIGNVQSAPEPRQRTMSLGVSRELGELPGDETLPSKEKIKADMLRCADLPPQLRGAPMRELLAHGTMKKFVYQWSRNQYCAESVKFLAACEMLNALTDKAARAAGLRRICENYISSEGAESVNIGGSSRKAILAKVRGAATDDELVALLPAILDKPKAEIMRVVEYDLYPQFSLLLEEVYAEKEAGTAAPLVSPKAATALEPLQSPKELSGGAGVVTDDATDYSRMKYVSEVAQDEAVLKELLLFCTDKQDQDAVLFVTLVQEFKRAVDGVRKNMSVNIQRIFLQDGSVHCLSFTEAKRRQAERDIVEKMLCPPVGVFDGLLQEAFAMIEASGVFRRFVKSKQPKKKKLFKTLGSQKRRGSFSGGVPPGAALAVAGAGAAFGAARGSPGLSRRPLSMTAVQPVATAPAAAANPDDKLEY